MRFDAFQFVISEPRMARYLKAAGSSRKAMTLYRLNLQLSQELFSVIGCLEVALRNAIDRVYVARYGNDWLRDSVQKGGFLNRPNCGKTPAIIHQVLKQLKSDSHQDLLARMDFGFWRYLFSRHQFHAGGQILLDVFPGRPASNANKQFNHKFIFGELEQVNMLRNRLAHHEPICFLAGHAIKNTMYVRNHYHRIIRLLRWMCIDENAFLYGLDHITEVADRIDQL